MSWFRRDKNSKVLIPPVKEQRHNAPGRFGDGPGSDPSKPGQRPSNYAPPSSAVYNPSRDRNLFDRTPSSTSDPALGARRDAPGDPYSRRRNAGNPQDDRAALFEGYNPAASQARRTDSGGYGEDDGEQKQEMDEDEETESIKKDLRWTKQETVSSTRNALRIAREAEETGRATLLKLGDQSEKLADTERHLDMAKAHTNRAEDATAELKQLNRSIFRPVITFNKTGKRRAEEARIEARHAEEREEREKAMADVRDSQNRIGRAATYGMAGRDDSAALLSPEEEQIQRRANRVRGEDRKRYQFEATESDEELEDELDDNLAGVLDVTKRLKALALAAGDEVDRQNERLVGLSDKTGNLTRKIDVGTDKLKKIK